MVLLRRAVVITVAATVLAAATFGTATANSPPAATEFPEVLATWSSWSDEGCDVECGQGSRTRTRSCYYSANSIADCYCAAGFAMNNDGDRCVRFRANTQGESVSGMVSSLCPVLSTTRGNVRAADIRKAGDASFITSAFGMIAPVAIGTMNVQGTWRNLDGYDADYLNWGSGEPSTGECVVLNPDNTLSTVDCADTSVGGVFCQHPVPSSTLDLQDGVETTMCHKTSCCDSDDLTKLQYITEDDVYVTPDCHANEAAVSSGRDCSDPDYIINGRPLWVVGNPGSKEVLEECIPR